MSGAPGVERNVSTRVAMVEPDEDARNCTRRSTPSEHATTALSNPLPRIRR